MSEVSLKWGCYKLFILLSNRTNMPLIYISNSPPQVERCSQHFQLGMNNTIVYQTMENKTRDVGNTSAKRITTKCLSNNRKPQLKV